jgi:hypothetical protein
MIAGLRAEENVSGSLEDSKSEGQGGSAHCSSREGEKVEESAVENEVEEAVGTPEQEEEQEGTVDKEPVPVPEAEVPSTHDEEGGGAEAGENGNGDTQETTKQTEGVAAAESSGDIDTTAAMASETDQHPQLSVPEIQPAEDPLSEGDGNHSARATPDGSTKSGTQPRQRMAFHVIGKGASSFAIWVSLSDALLC